MSNTFHVNQYEVIICVWVNPTQNHIPMLLASVVTKQPPLDRNSLLRVNQGEYSILSQLKLRRWLQIIPSTDVGGYSYKRQVPHHNFLILHKTLNSLEQLWRPSEPKSVSNIQVLFNKRMKAEFYTSDLIYDSSRTATVPGSRFEHQLVSLLY